MEHRVDRTGRAYPVYVTEKDARRLRDAHESRWDGLVRDFRSVAWPRDGTRHSEGFSEKMPL